MDKKLIKFCKENGIKIAEITNVPLVLYDEKVIKTDHNIGLSNCLIYKDVIIDPWYLLPESIEYYKKSMNIVDLYYDELYNLIKDI